MKTKTYVILSVLQFLSAIALSVAFFACAPWLMSYLIEDLPQHSSVAIAPENAVSFASGRGQYTFFDDSPRTNPLRTITALSFIAANWAFLVFSALYVTKRKNAEKLKAEETNDDSE